MNDDWLLDLAEAVADGTDTPWATRLAAVESADYPVLRALRTIGRLAAANEVADFTRATEPTVRTPPLVEPPQGDETRAGQRWQHLEVLEPVGEGASASVYLAVDTVLGREVALKLIPIRDGPSDAAVAELLSEAKLLAKINHPNVAVVYGAAHSGPCVGIWMEYVRGQTLHDLVLGNGPLSWLEATVVGIDVARAVGAVHQQRILHRDVKAKNVLREDGGRIVLVDLGIGIELERAADPTAFTAGTPLYLAPELLNGAKPSIQADVYSLGVLCYFLTTGRYPVEGESLGELRVAHRLQERRSLREHRSDLDEGFVTAVEKALESDPNDRYKSVHQAERALASALRAGTAARPAFELATERWRNPEPSRTEGSRSPLGTAAIAASLILVFLIGLAAARWMRTPQSERAERRISFSFGPPTGLVLTDGARNVPVLAPDGQHLIYIASDSTGRQGLWTRKLDEFVATAIKGTTGATFPFFAPNSQSIGFFSERKLRISHEPGAPPIAVAPASLEPRGATWSSRDQILYSPGPRSGLMQVDVLTGEVKEITSLSPQRGEIGHQWPQFLPDEEHFVFFVDSNSEDVRGVYLGSLGGGEAEALLDIDSSAVFASGHLLYVRDGDLLAQRLEEGGWSLRGRPHLVAESVAVTTSHQAAISASATDLLCYIPAALRNRSHLQWRSQSGQPIESISATRHLRNPALSPTSRYVAAEDYDETPTAIRVFDLERNRELRLGVAEARNMFPVWGPDGDTLIFASDRDGKLDIFRQMIDSLEAPELAYSSKVDKMPVDCSPDGEYLSFIEYSPEQDYDVLLLPLHGGAVPEPLVATDYDEVAGRFSPSGKLIAYVSNDSGKPQVYVRLIRGDLTRCQISTDGGHDPVWGKDDGTLYFLSDSGEMMRSSFSFEECDGEGLAFLFQTQTNRPSSSRNHYAIEREGTRILFNDPADETQESKEFRMIAGWRAGLLPP